MSNKCLTLVVQERWCYKKVCHGAVVVGFNLRHSGPEERDIVFNRSLDHGLVDLVVDFWDLAENIRIKLLQGHYKHSPKELNCGGIIILHSLKGKCILLSAQIRKPCWYDVTTECLQRYLPWQPPGPFSSRNGTGFGFLAERSSQTGTLEPEQASYGSACWAWLDSCHSWECGWMSPSGGSGYLRGKARSVQFEMKIFQEKGILVNSDWNIRLLYHGTTSLCQYSWKVWLHLLSKTWLFEFSFALMGSTNAEDDVMVVPS